MTDTPQYENLQVTELEHSEIELSASIPAAILDTFREKALAELGESVQIDGFRKGAIPENILVGHVGEGTVMEKAANLALHAVYPHILQEKKLLLLGTPNISVTKLAQGNPLEFTLRAPVPPQFELPDYKSIAKKSFSEKIDKTASDKEIEDVLMHFRRERFRIDAIQKDSMDPEEAAKKMTEAKIEDLPALDTEFVASLGDFKTLDAFKSKVRENVEYEKELRGKEKRRASLIEALVEKTDIDLPRVLIEHELARIRAQFENDITRSGTTVDNYLKNLNKSIEDMQKEWEPAAIKQATFQLILNKIAETEAIVPDQAAIKKEVDHILEHHKDANKMYVEANVTMHLRNQKVFEHLEALATA